MNTYKIKIGFKYIDVNNVESMATGSYDVLANNENEATQNLNNFLINDNTEFETKIDNNFYILKMNNFNILDIYQM